MAPFIGAAPIIRATLVVLTFFGSARLVAKAPLESQNKSPGGMALAAASWETLATPIVDIRYPEGDRADAELYARFMENTHRALRAEFSSVDVDTLTRTPVPCTVWLHPQASGTISAGNALASISYGTAPVCELHFLTPSAYAASDHCCTKIGEPRDIDQLHRIAAHEYSTILLDRLTRQRTGWRFHDAPQWFEQGYEEYLGCVLASDHTRKVTLAKYRELVANAPDRLRDTDVENPYIDGAVLVEFLHERFGREKVQAILMSTASTFEDAFRQATGNSQREFFVFVRAALTKKK
jgi:hypothetical protein